MRRIAICAAAGLLLATWDAVAYFINYQPGGRLTMNLNMGTTPQSLIVGTTTWNQEVQDAMNGWNSVGIGRGPDYQFFSVRSPLVNADPCNSSDRLYTVAWMSTQCGGLAFGSALAVTRTISSDGVVQEVDMWFDANRSWNAYEGPLRAGSYDLYRVAAHELGHAMGLAHPDDHGQAVDAIMNARTSDIDRLQPDDVAGARALAWTVATAPPPPTPPTTPPMTLARVKVLNVGTRASVHPGRPVYGGFSIGLYATGAATSEGAKRLDVAAIADVAVRGPSLQTLGITQRPLDVPLLRMYDATGYNFATATNCPSDSSIAYSYANRGVPLSTRDTCTSVRLSVVDGTYTFTINPTGSLAGEVLFEVTFNTRWYNDSPIAVESGPTSVASLGSRGTVARGEPMFGGFTLAENAAVEIAVRGPSLQTLGITQDPLDSPRLRFYDAAGKDLLFDSNGAAGVGSCARSQSTAVRYAGLGQPLHERDACGSLRLNSGTYTFSIEPSGTDNSGEVLFEVKFGK